MVLFVSTSLQFVAIIRKHYISELLRPNPILFLGLIESVLPICNYIGRVHVVANKVHNKYYIFYGNIKGAV